VEISGLCWKRERMKVRLSDIAEIRSGYQFREKVEPDPRGWVPVIQIKDLTGDFRLRTDDLIRVSMERTEPYLVDLGDVLFLARGHRLGAAAVNEPLAGTIATGYFFILRPSPRVRPGYLAWAINQREFQDQMRPLIRGSHIPLITKGDFAGLRLELPPLNVQDKIVALDELHRKERQLVAEIQAKRAELIHTISQRAAKRRTARKKG
jgi:restriction endonuclease S subunit